MWNRPHIMSAVADLLFAGAATALLVAGVVWVAKRPHFTLSDVVVVSELKEVRRTDLEQVLMGQLKGNFFNVNVEAIRQSIEHLAWVRAVDVRRRWPSSLELRIEEHTPVASWGENTGQLVNTQGEVFVGVMRQSVPLPVLYGPMLLSSEILDYYREAVTLLQPIGRKPKSLTLSPRLAVQLKLDDGTVVELGRQQAQSPIKERIKLFADYYPSVRAVEVQQPTVVDMRYPTGFAMRLAATNVVTKVSEGKGK